MFSSEAGAAVWLGDGGQMMRPCSSNFMQVAQRDQRYSGEDGPRAGQEVRRARPHHLAAAAKPNRCAGLRREHRPLRDKIAMRHLNSGSKLGKQPDHRRAVLRSLVTNLLEHGRITTTLTRAKAARPVAEKMITLGKRDTLQSRRQAASYIMLPAVTQKLFSEIAPKFADRAGGYTRIIHAGNRVGDNAKVAILELIGYEFKLKEKKEKPKKEEEAEVK